MTQRRHDWTEEDAAFAAAQWASGIMNQRELGKLFGYANGATVCVQINAFLSKYTGLWLTESRYQNSGRKALVKDALAAFVAKRAA